jgi:ubiquinone/menaquinone biosynthesis C-methylase UbiE
MDKDTIMAIADAYRESKILLAANEYDIFTILSKRPLMSVELAELVNADTRALELLMNSLVAMGFLKKNRDKYSNTKVAEKYLVKNTPDYIGDWVRHANDGYLTWGRLEERVFKSKPVRKDWKERFLRALDNTAIEKAEEIMDKVELKGKCLLDLGGGSGAYSWVFVKKRGGKATIVETPEMADFTRKILQEKNAENIDVIEGDFLKDPIGESYDIALISNIIHFQSIEENKLLIKRAYQALVRGGAVVIHDYLLNDDMTSPRFATIFAIHMLLNSDEGRTYSWSEVEGWLREAGFRDLRRYQLKESRIITGVKH